MSTVIDRLLDEKTTTTLQKRTVRKRKTRAKKKKTRMLPRVKNILWRDTFLITRQLQVQCIS